MNAAMLSIADEPRHCVDHGNYNSRQLFGRWSPCPQCQAGDIERRRQADEAERRAAQIEAAIRSTAIPRKYADARLEHCGEHGAVVEAWLAAVQGGDHGNLLVSGPVGTGKTYLTAALALAGAAKGLPCRYTSVAGYLRALRETWGAQAEKTERSVYQLYLKPRILVLDEIGTEAGDRDAIRVSELISDRYDDALPTVFVTNKTTKGEGGDNPLKTAMGERAYSRMREGLTYIRMIGEDRRRPKGRAA